MYTKVLLEAPGQRTDEVNSDFRIIPESHLNFSYIRSLAKIFIRLRSNILKFDDGLLGDRDEAAGGGGVKRSPAFVVTLVHVGAMFHQKLDQV